MSLADYFTCGLRNEWKWLFTRTNCTSFTFWILEFELDRVSGSLDVDCMFLGIGFWLCIAVSAPSPLLIKALEEVVQSGKERS